MGWHGMRRRMKHKHFPIGNACWTYLRGICKVKGLGGHLYARKGDLLWSTYIQGKGVRIQGDKWWFSSPSLPSRWMITGFKRIWGGGTFSWAMGGRVFLDFDQENPAESCRCGRSNDAGLRLNDDTNKHEKEWRQSKTPIRQTSKNT